MDIFLMDLIAIDKINDLYPEKIMWVELKIPITLTGFKTLSGFRYLRISTFDPSKNHYNGRLQIYIYHLHLIVYFHMCPS
jgi:hypothetical protein